MKHIIILFLLMTFIWGGNVSAGEDGTRGTSTDLGGGITVHRFNDGTRGTSTDLGDGITVHNLSE